MYKTIGIMGNPRKHAAKETHIRLFKQLKKMGKNVLIDSRLQDPLTTYILEKETKEKQHSHIRIDHFISKSSLSSEISYADLDALGNVCDIIVVVGGDGNMLGAAREMAKYDTPMIGINRGNLGFLTDLDPDNVEEELNAVLSGEHIIEKRFMIQGQVVRNGTVVAQKIALNELVIHAEKVATMIDFDVHINDKFAFSQRSDGLIISTPTGSTAYAMSAGGSIMCPDLNAISLIPMFPHTLSFRPLVIDGKKMVKVVARVHNGLSARLTNDGQDGVELHDGDEILIEQFETALTLAHPKNYNYFTVLREKLGWANKLF